MILAGFFPRNVLFGGMGWDGMGNQKCPLICFNFICIKPYFEKKGHANRLIVAEVFLEMCYLMGWDGMGNQKCPSIFLNLRYIKHLTHIHILYIIVVRTNFLWILNFGQVGGPNKKIQKHPLGWIFFKSY